MPVNCSSETRGGRHVESLGRDEARALIENAFASLLDPQQDAEDLSRYFAPNYVQIVDGKNGL